MDNVVRLLGDHVEFSDKQFKVLLALIGNQREAIYGIAEIVDGLPGADKAKVAEVIKSLDEFDPLAAMAD